MFRFKSIATKMLVIITVLAVLNVEKIVAAFGLIPVTVVSVVCTFVAAAISAWNECKKEGV